MPGALIGICPNRQLHLEEVHALGAELCHERIVGSTQDQQVCFAYQEIAEWQPEPTLLVYALMVHQQSTQLLDGLALIRLIQVSEPEQLRTPVL
jgi:hypothetical protein